MALSNAERQARRRKKVRAIMATALTPEDGQNLLNMLEVAADAADHPSASNLRQLRWTFTEEAMGTARALLQSKRNPTDG